MLLHYYMQELYSITHFESYLRIVNYVHDISEVIDFSNTFLEFIFS